MNAPATITTALPATLTLPTLEKGELYAGLVLEDGAWHHLILLAAPDHAPLGWNKAMEWAKEQQGDLPTRREQAVLYGNLPGEFKENWYWSSTPYAGDESSAWSQTFTNGSQGSYRKYYELRARAVRRVTI